MRVELNHTIVYARDKRESSMFLADILGLPEPQRFGPFLAIELDNHVTLDYYESDGPIVPAHYAFLITEDDFNNALERITKRNVRYWADPFHTSENTINRRDGGRGVYFEDPNGHNMEILTRSSGGGKA